MDTDKKTLIKLSAVLAFLIILFGISFLTKNSESKSMTVNTALVNPKYKNEISEIRIFIPYEEYKDTDFKVTDIERKQLILKKTGNIWAGEIQKGTDKVIWPADSSTVENLIEYCTKIRKLFEKSSSAKNLEALSVTEEKAKVLEFYTDDGNLVSKILFGNENQLTSRINVRSSARLNVYEIEDDISLYLNASSSFYADPYLYPLSITVFSEEEKAYLLRHGNINDSLKEKNECINLIPVNIHRKDFVDGSTVILKIYQSAEQQENTYTVIPEYKASPAASKNDSYAINRFNYTYSISSWTYGKLFEN